MLKIDLQNIIDAGNLDRNEIAKLLFPKAKYEVLALKRILEGKAFLDSDQISKLALHLGCSASDLYTGGSWTAKVENRVHVFKNGDYRAELDTETWKTKIFHNESLYHEAIINSEGVLLSQYLKDLDSLIKKHSDENNN